MTTIHDAMRSHCDTCGLTKYLNIIIEQSEKYVRKSLSNNLDFKMEFAHN